MSLDLFDRPGFGEQAILVSVDFGEGHADSLQEFHELAVSAGVRPVATITASRHSPDSRYFIGSGKAEEVKMAVESEQAEVVLFNHELSASQERNLEKLFACRVLDRTGLILDIFAQRARSFEGKLQVELAQLQHLSTRLVRGWTHLERQKGGIGLRGPGETQLETDRRLVGKRIAQLQKRLSKVNRQRQQSSRARHRADVPTVSLVGYTNAGKSTLFNRLVGAEVYAQDQLFATLDPTLRRLELAGVGAVVLADTVGFIRDLPHDLVAAFRATLQETQTADLLLHIVDAHAEERNLHMQEVNSVLAQIDADKVPQIVVYNKVDLCDQAPATTLDEAGRVKSIGVSALQGTGLDELQAAIAEFFSHDKVKGWIKLLPSEGRIRAAFYELGEILSEQSDAQGGNWLHIHIQQEHLQHLQIDPERVISSEDQKRLTVAGAA